MISKKSLLLVNWFLTSLNHRPRLLSDNCGWTAINNFLCFRTRVSVNVWVDNNFQPLKRAQASNSTVYCLIGYRKSRKCRRKQSQHVWNIFFSFIKMWIVASCDIELYEKVVKNLRARRTQQNSNNIRSPNSSFSCFNSLKAKIAPIYTGDCYNVGRENEAWRSVSFSLICVLQRWRSSHKAQSFWKLERCRIKMWNWDKARWTKDLKNSRIGFTPNLIFRNISVTCKIISDETEMC